MIFKLFRKKKEPEIPEHTEVVEVSGEPKGKFIVEEVFQIKWIGLILAGRVFKGEMSVGDILKLPDGRFLRVKGIEKGRKKVDKAVVNEAVGVIIEGVGWKPSRKDIEKLRVREIIERIRKEATRKYLHMPKDLVKKLVEKEIRDQLEKELDKIALEIYTPK